MNNDGSENNGEKNTLKIFTEMTDLNKIINLQAAAERKTRRRKKKRKNTYTDDLHVYVWWTWIK